MTLPQSAEVVVLAERWRTARLVRVRPSLSTRLANLAWWVLVVGINGALWALILMGFR